MVILLIRTILLYTLIIFALRIMGKRQIGELQPSELVVTILVSNIATLSIEDNNVPLLGSIIPILMLISCEVVISVVTMKSSRLRKIITGNPYVIIRDGVIDQKGMKDLRWTIDDLMEQLRINNIFDIDEVAYAVVETSGKLSSYQKASVRPPSAKMMSIKVKSDYILPMVLINDGELIKNAFPYLGLDEKWLQSTLKAEGVSVEEVFLMSCDSTGRYYIAKKEGKKP
ncbi:DUF421 domain-containing protein [Oscillospiraceae bacterium MB08-C2-2]|nr:DUF421 domain-containing protein [Oscillospiraceae bacterium MB08-C2-2]